MNGTKIRMVITDDDSRISHHIENIVTSAFDDVEILAKPINVSQSIQAIKEFSPNLLCLDVDLKGETSFDILKQINRSSGLPIVIFVTAHPTYALEAIKNEAADYVLKPINRDELCKAINKARIKIIDHHLVNSIGRSKKQVSDSDGVIQVPQLDGVEFIKLKDILFFKAQRNYTELVLKGGNKILSSKTLKHYVESTPRTIFFKPHRSYLININELKSLKTSEGGYLIMSNGEEIPIIRSKRTDLLQLLDIVV